MRYPSPHQSPGIYRPVYSDPLGVVNKSSRLHRLVVSGTPGAKGVPGRPEKSRFRLLSFTAERWWEAVNKDDTALLIKNQ